MSKVIDGNFLELIKALTIRIDLSLKSGNLGNKRSHKKGSSVEFSDYREYVHGDDFRRIDWNALARFERVFIKLYMEEQEAPVTVLMDQSESMKEGGKRELAIKVAATFSYVALSDYDTVSLATFNDDIASSLKTLRGRGAFNTVSNHLEKINFSGGSDLMNVVTKWHPYFRKGLTVLVTDFMYDHQFLQVMKLLAFKKQKVIVCHILSEEETNPKFDENVRIIDSETNEFINIDTGIEAINIYKKALNRHMNELKETCMKYGAEYFLLNTTQPYETFIKKLYTLH